MTFGIKITKKKETTFNNNGLITDKLDYIFDPKHISFIDLPIRDLSKKLVDMYKYNTNDDSREAIITALSFLLAFLEVLPRTKPILENDLSMSRWYDFVDLEKNAYNYYEYFNEDHILKRLANYDRSLLDYIIYNIENFRMEELRRLKSSLLQRLTAVFNTPSNENRKG